jgi:hypothetical protein
MVFQPGVPERINNDIDEPLLHLATDIAGKLGNDSGNAVAAL